MPCARSDRTLCIYVEHIVDDAGEALLRQLRSSFDAWSRSPAFADLSIETRSEVHAQARVLDDIARRLDTRDADVRAAVEGLMRKAEV